MYRLDDDFIYRLLISIFKNTNQLYTSEIEHINVVERIDKLENKIDALIEKIDNLNIPTKISELENDTEYLQAEDVQELINQSIQSSIIDELNESY